MSKCEGCIQEIRKLLDSAKREPAHSPTEDALIDAVEMLLELVTDANFRRTSQNQTVSGGVEAAHEGTTADKSGSREPEKLNNAPNEKDLACYCWTDFFDDGTGKCKNCGATPGSLAESSLSSPPPKSDLSAPTSPAPLSTQLPKEK